MYIIFLTLDRVFLVFIAEGAMMNGSAYGMSWGGLKLNGVRGRWWEEILTWYYI